MPPQVGNNSGTPSLIILLYLQYQSLVSQILYLEYWQQYNTAVYRPCWDLSYKHWVAEARAG